jgi:hypothetical protein
MYLEGFYFLSRLFRSPMVTSISPDVFAFPMFLGRGVLASRFVQKEVKILISKLRLVT